jgi:transposase, IS6 family
VTTDRAAAYPRVIDELAPTAGHITEQDANNAVEADPGRLTARRGPMRGLQRLASARTISAGPAFVHNLRRGHHELTVDVPKHDRVPVAFAELPQLV